jgi:hypothetical protein
VASIATCAREVLEELPGEERPEERIEEIQDVEEQETETGLAALKIPAGAIDDALPTLARAMTTAP